MAKTKKTEEQPKKKAVVKKQEKKFRLLKNPNQTAPEQTYYTQNQEAIVFPKDGYHFSLDKEMDATIEFFKEQGFVEVN